MDLDKLEAFIGEVIVGAVTTLAALAIIAVVAGFR